MSEPNNRIPAHVPPRLVHDFDFYFGGTNDEVFAAWKSLHDEGKPEIFWTPRNGGHWVVTRADDVDEVYRNYEAFTTVPFANAIPFREMPARPLPIASDPPDHSEYRRLIQAFFVPKKVAEVEKHARVVAGELIDSLIAKGKCEFYNDFAMHMPIHVFLNLAGLPISDWRFMMPWARTLVREPDISLAEGIARDVWAYLKERIELRRAQPGDDPLTSLVQGEAFGRKLTDEECIGSALNILFAGVDTTPATMSFVAHFLATHPEHRRQLIEDPSLIPAAVEEFLRRFPSAVTGRAVKHDMEYKGVTMKAGDPILSPAVLANLDERRFPDPMTVDFARRGQAGSLTFGSGPHRCIGLMLARMQIRVFIEEWLARIPDFEVAPDDVPEVRCGTAMAMVHLPLVW